HGVTRYAYDTENNLTSITDALGRQTSFTYDSLGRVTQTTFPSSLLESYSYDAVGNLTSKTDRKGQIISYSYDDLDRLTRKQYPDSTAVDYSYDLVGRLTNVSDPTGTYGLSFDNMGRLTGTTTNYSFLPARTFTNSYAYDAASNRTSFTDPENGATNYVYDTLNRLSSLTNFSSQQFTFSYDALGRRTQLTRPNGVNTSYSYDNLSRLLSVLHKLGAQTIDGATYTVDAVGSRTAKANQLNSVTENYGYDAIYQLAGVTQGATTTESYAYDPVGNRLSSLGVSPYSYNNSNQLTSTPAATYTYDNNGNTLTKVDAGGTTTYGWDFENRLVSVTLPGSGGTVSFKYDPTGRRIQKSSAAGTTNYAYDGADMTEEVDAAGSVLARYAMGPGIDQPLAMLRSGATSYYQADGLGSITSVTDASGGLAASYAYDSFGKPIQSTGTLVSPFRYTGREFDSETGLYYYRARYYDSNGGRFISEDPLGPAAGLSLYAYVNNDPVKLFDPWGLISWDYQVAYYKHGWGVLLGASTQVDLPPSISVDCQCVGKGKYKAIAKVSFTITIVYGTKGQLEHEKGHLDILKNYLSSRTPHYADTYERVYPSKEQCLNAEKATEKAIDRDLARDWREIKKLQHTHEDWLQNAIQWIYDRF
ncbi:MAG: RHS repeat-associated core domain-containing protein, partial [Terriglobales bacterium]